MLHKNLYALGNFGVKIQYTNFHINKPYNIIKVHMPQENFRTILKRI